MSAIAPASSFNPDSILDFEKRSGLKDDDISDFIRKVDAVNDAIAQMKAGTLEPEDVHVEGLPTPEEKAAEAAKREAARERLRLQQEQAAALRKAEEAERWWRGAELLHGPRRHANSGSGGGGGSGDSGGGGSGGGGGGGAAEDGAARQQLGGGGGAGGALLSAEERQRLSDREVGGEGDASRALLSAEERQRLSDRYSLEYSRWETWTPDDPATQEEVAQKEAEEDAKRNAAFEASNPDFCREFSEDAQARQRAREKRANTANSLRLKGNRYFNARQYQKALGLYMDSLRDEPYCAAVLSNAAMAHIRLKQWGDALEFCNRTLHVEPANVKALSRRATVHVVQGDREAALRDLNEAVRMDPACDDVVRQRDRLQTDMEDDAEEARVLRSQLMAWRGGALAAAALVLHGGMPPAPAAAAAAAATAHNTATPPGPPAAPAASEAAAAAAQATAEAAAAAAAAAAPAPADAAAAAAAAAQLVCACLECEDVARACGRDAALLSGLVAALRRRFGAVAGDPDAAVRGATVAAEALRGCLIGGGGSAAADTLSDAGAEAVDALAAALEQQLDAPGQRGRAHAHAQEAVDAICGALANAAMHEVLRPRFGARGVAAALTRTFSDPGVGEHAQSLALAALMNACAGADAGAPARAAAHAAGVTAAALRILSAAAVAPAAAAPPSQLLARSSGLLARLAAAHAPAAAALATPAAARAVAARLAASAALGGDLAAAAAAAREERDQLVRVAAAAARAAAAAGSSGGAGAADAAAALAVLGGGACVRALVSFLPPARRGAGGAVTRDSVALAPAWRAPAAVAGNVCGALLHLIGDGSGGSAAAAAAVAEAGGIERLLCLFANSEDGPARKNAAICVARLARDCALRPRIEALRGMEMLVQAGRALVQ
ncbi:hypothetical protein JKP88DRAFT_308946 [Tribonema minus]|uniref:Uncharacterized protein n=1 Tax=Tribonema minus TaxID=303371 RepID=A0A835Z620_9STRA|nr:hypothetical protein JKP88DRAFT_308946 [Tribonema minus]